jgi:hypothetical protein
MTVDDLTENELDWYEERAAIMEYDANMSRYEAERRAMQETLKRRELI